MTAKRLFRLIAIALAAASLSTVFSPIPALAIESQPSCSVSEPSGNRPTLKQGHYGPQVQKLQELLGIGDDGCFGKQTDRTVRDYQSRKGMHVDGIVGSCTWKALYGESIPSSCKASTSSGSRQAVNADAKPAQCGSYKCVSIDQGANKVRLFSKNGSLVATYCMVDNPAKLAKGVYYIGYKDKHGTDDSSGKLELNYFQSFAGDIGFHQIPIRKSNGQQIHDDSFLCTNQKKSDGCIRLSLAGAQHVYQFTYEGMPVVVF